MGRKAWEKSKEKHVWKKQGHYVCTGKVHIWGIYSFHSNNKTQHLKKTSSARAAPRLSEAK